MSRSNSMTSCGQCRVAPLIPCIQDAAQLYDYSVKILFKLHSALPPDTLDGHRKRFLKQFRDLKQFYQNSNTLQYFRNLISIPSLPEVRQLIYYSKHIRHYSTGCHMIVIRSLLISIPKVDEIILSYAINTTRFIISLKTI